MTLGAFPRATSVSAVSARVGLLIVAWALAWGITPSAVHRAPWSSFAWWTTMKMLVWFALGAALFRPEGRRAWFGNYCGRVAAVFLLAVAWILADTGAAHLGLKPPARTPTGPELLSRWNATLNVLVIAPLFEEVLFRGVIWSRLEETLLRRVHVWLLMAAAFAALHVPGWLATQGASRALWPQLGLVFLAGLFCGSGRWLTGSVWPAVFLHLVNNVVSMGVFQR